MKLRTEAQWGSMVRSLSAPQREALETLNDGPCDDAWLCVSLGASRNRTMRALKSRGLARYYGSSELWYITKEGREALKLLTAQTSGHCHDCMCDDKGNDPDCGPRGFPPVTSGV